MAKIKFTDEMMSRVLSEHDAGNMYTGGYKDYDLIKRYCINQVALCYVNKRNEAPTKGAYARDKRLADLFDVHYRRHWTPEQMLEFIETRGKNVDKEDNA